MILRQHKGRVNHLISSCLYLLYSYYITSFFPFLCPLADRELMIVLYTRQNLSHNRIWWTGMSVYADDTHLLTRQVFRMFPDFSLINKGRPSRVVAFLWAKTLEFLSERQNNKYETSYMHVISKEKHGT